MNRQTAITVGMAAITTLSATLVGTAANAATMDCSGSKKSKAQPTPEVIRPGDRPDHDLKLSIRNHTISSRDPDFDGSQQTAYSLEDVYGGSGPIVGYFMYTLTSGEKLWAKFDSITELTRPGSNWEVNYQGTFRFIGGTGKYAAIRGGGHYRGKVTAERGFEETSTCSAEY